MAQPAQPNASQNDDDELNAATERAVAEWYRLDPLANPANIESLLPSPEALAEMAADRAEEQRLLEELVAMGIEPESSTASTEILAEDREDR